METKDINGTEIFSAGIWNGDEYTVADLDEIARGFAETQNAIKPYLKLGHSKQQKILQNDGLPAAGWIDNVRRVGNKLVADFKHIPKKLHDIIAKGGYRRVSSEIFLNFSINGKTYPKILKAVALLGADTPAVRNLDDILALYDEEMKPVTLSQEYETKTFESDITNLNSQEELKNMKTIEQLQQELEQERAKLADAQTQIANFSQTEAKSKEALKMCADEKDTMKKNFAEMEKQFTEQREEAFRVKATATADELIRNKKILPAQKEQVFAMLLDALHSPTEKVFKLKEGETEKELSHFDYVVKIFSAQTVDVNTEPGTEVGAPPADAGDDSALTEKAKTYIAKQKEQGIEVSFREAVLAVAPGRPE